MRAGPVKTLTLLLTGALCALPILADDEKVDLPEAPGKAITEKMCGKCHGLQVVVSKTHSEDGWAAVVVNMAQRGMQATEDEMYEVVQYLTNNIKAPKINVNKASPKILEFGLDLTPKEAQAIIAARAQGAFKSIDDLKRVAGVDGDKIDAKKNRIVF